MVNVVKAIDIKDGNLLSTGSSNLDKLLNGGFPEEGIIEITGESGCGKSQLCMQLTLTVQYPLDQGGFNASAVYICTEERFQSKRLYQLIRNFPKRYYKHENNEIDFGNNILVFHANDFDYLKTSLEKIPAMQKHKNIKLIIIDSITAVFRGNYAASDAHRKVIELRCIGNILHKLSFQYKILVICVNQMTQSLADGKNVPALGLAWANLVTTRILLTRDNNSRQMQVIFSPHLPSKVAVDFTVEESGVV